jgi:branched-chain amino acid transport system ATP-binding protein
MMQGNATAALLSVQDVRVSFGGIHALQGVSFEVAPRTICGVIGPNGAGKTTLFNCLSCFYKPSSGSITFAGQRLTELDAHEVGPLGLARTFQHVALFPAMSVRDNVMVGLHSRSRAGFWSAALRLPQTRREEIELIDQTEEILEELELTAISDRLVSSLPFATRKRVELARALVSNPTLVMLDEPAAGLNHEEVDHLRSTILRIKTHRNAAVLLVEHHMNLVMRCSDQVVALNFGCKIADGDPQSVGNHPEVIAAYLGGVTA